MVKKHEIKQAQTTLFFMYYIHVRLTFQTAEVYQTDHRIRLGFPRFFPGCYPWLQLLSLFSKSYILRLASASSSAKNLAIHYWKCRLVTNKVNLGRSSFSLHFLPMLCLSIYMDQVLLINRFKISTKPLKLEFPCSLFLLIQPLLKSNSNFIWLHIP